jgi:hypothetical protein
MNTDDGSRASAEDEPQNITQTGSARRQPTTRALLYKLFLAGSISAA